MSVWECGRRGTLLAGGGGRETERGEERENKRHERKRNKVFRGTKLAGSISDKGFRVTMLLSKSKNLLYLFYPQNLQSFVQHFVQTRVFRPHCMAIMYAVQIHMSVPIHILVVG